MHLLLTDRLTCPRCGPTFGLILLANRLEDRRVFEGVLGCPNCRDSFPIREGFADLRAPPRDEPADGRAGSAPDMPNPGSRETDTEADRLRALLGIARGPGTVALLGEAARQAALLAASVEELQVVALDADAIDWPDEPGVSRAVASPGLPFFSGMLRGIVVDGTLGPSWLEEAARVVSVGSRVVVIRAPEGVTETLEGCGLAVLASEAETVVATRG